MPRRAEQSGPDNSKVVGQKFRKRRRSPLSDFGRMLREKQDLKQEYGLRERQFRNYVLDVLNQRTGDKDITNILIQNLERRLDNTIYRAGFALSRSQARQFVTHGHFLVNGRRVDVPSYKVQKEDVIELRDASRKGGVFNNNDITEHLKKYESPAWLKSDVKKLRAEILGEPSIDEVQPDIEVSLIFEFYSR